MTRTEHRLSDALGAAASALREDTLRPLTVPERRRRRPAWAAPVAAVASVLLVVGLAVAVAARLPGFGQPASGPPGPVAALPRYYVDVDFDGSTVVRSTVTGSVTARVPYPRPNPDDSGLPIVAAARNGTFFLATLVRGTREERIYRFRVTGSGKVSGFALVPGGVIRDITNNIDAMASAPDGSRLAISVGQIGGVSRAGDQIVVINVATGAKSVWRGGMSGLGRSFSVASLSWTGNGHELVILAQWCTLNPFDHESCGSAGGGRTAEVWALDPASGGGLLDSGHLLLRQSARYPYIAQALISPDGSTITAVVLTGPTGPTSGIVPRDVSVRQISLASGQQRRVLYRRRLPAFDGVLRVPDFLALSQDGEGRHWLLSGGIHTSRPDRANGFNGRIDGGQLIPMPPVYGTEVAEAW